MWKDVSGGGGDKDHLIITPNTAKLLHILVKDDEEPHSYWTHYIPSKVPAKKGRSVRCPGRDICPACADGSFKTARRHSINVYDYESKAIKILEKGNTVFEQLKMIKDQYGSFGKVDVSIKRSGEGKSTTYMAIPIPRMEPFDEALVAQGKFSLEAMKPAHTPEQIEKIIHELNNTSPHVTMEMDSPDSGYLEPTSTSPVLEFGKYKGKTFDEIAELGDLNYVKWCAENLDKKDLKEDAAKVVAKNTGKPAPIPAPVVEKPSKQLIDEIQIIINTDPRYAKDIGKAVEKMKQATASPTYPNGKTLLLDYSMDELVKLKTLLQGE